MEQPIPIYCVQGKEPITIHVNKTQTVKEVAQECLKFRSPDDTRKIPRLYNTQGCIVPIGPNIPPNSEDRRYRLQFCEHQEFRTARLDEMEKLQKDIEAINKNVERLFQFSYSTAQSHKLSITPAIHRVEQIIKQLDLEPKEGFKRKFNPEVYEELKKPTFDIWAYQEDDYIHFMAQMLKNVGVVDHFSIQEPVLMNFLGAIQQAYNGNPFHNFKHAFCVTQMMYAILHMGLVDKLNMIEKFGLLLAAIGHDMDHPGLNNAYQMNALTELAITYNDSSPLENHHCAMLFALLRHQEFNILANVSSNDYKDIRKLVITCILATDMGKHAELIGKMREITANFNIEDPAHKNLLFQLLIKCADISNEARPTKISEPWVDLLLQEFFTQSDREKAEGLPFMPFMDREKVTKPSAQVGFIGFVLLPLMEDVSKIVPELKCLVVQITAAKAYYLAMMN